VSVRLSTAAIIAVGSELLTPFRVDTNSLIITEQLNRLGIDVVLKAVVGDDREQLAFVLGAALVRAELVMFSGGLGPTDDDVTREVVAKVLARPLHEDPARTEMLRARYKARGFPGPMPEINRRQAMVPEAARVIENDRGSAPGLWLEDGTRVVVLLPGPPRELKPMLTGTVVAWLADRAPGVGIERRVLRIARMVESQVEQTVQPLYREWTSAALPVSATILAAPGQVDLHLSVRAAADVAAAALTQASEQVVALLGAHVYSVNGASLEEVVGAALAERGLRIAVAESCTGGLIASRLTDVPGSSRYLDEGIIAYANRAKTSLLQVPETLLDEQGAVSEPVARAMAEGVRQHADADIGLGVTGIAGPGGGSPEKPVGTVAIAVTSREGAVSRSRLFRFPGERDRVKFQASQAALDMVRRFVIGVDEP
jgi:nicotinamide-nucleotide amidase